MCGIELVEARHSIENIAYFVTSRFERFVGERWR